MLKVNIVGNKSLVVFLMSGSGLDVFNTAAAVAWMCASCNVTTFNDILATQLSILCRLTI